MKKKELAPPGKTLEQKCNFEGHTNVKHYSGQYLGVPPDCNMCDGYGDYAKKYKWECYNPRNK